MSDTVPDVIGYACTLPANKHQFLADFNGPFQGVHATKRPAGQKTAPHPEQMHRKISGQKGHLLSGQI